MVDLKLNLPKVITPMKSIRTNSPCKVLWGMLMTLIPHLALSQLSVLGSDTLRVSGSASQFEIVGYGHIANTGNVPLNVRWKRVSSQLPSSWTCTICDLNFCFPSTVDSADFVLPARDTANLDGHFYLNNQPGSGYQRISLRNLANPSLTQFITYIGSTLGSGQIVLTHQGAEVDWRLIGSQLWMSIPEEMLGNTLQIMDVRGKILSSNIVNDIAQPIDLHSLPSGVYIARLNMIGMGAVVYRFYWQP